MKFGHALVAILLFTGCHKSKSHDDDHPLGARHGGVPTSREGQMFLLGEKLSQAAMVNGRAAPDVVERTFHAAETVADVTLKQPLDPLPTPRGNASDTAAGLHYLLDGQGKVLGKKIATDFGDASAATFELGVKLNMLPSLYIDDPKDTMADTLAATFGRLAVRAKLPDSALGPLVAKLKARAPMSAVTDMTFALDDSLPVTIADIYEKADDKAH
jgi:hypothetical protein